MLVSCTARIVPTADSTSGNSTNSTGTDGRLGCDVSDCAAGLAVGTFGENFPASQSISTDDAGGEAAKDERSENPSNHTEPEDFRLYSSLCCFHPTRDSN